MDKESLEDEYSRPTLTASERKLMASSGSETGESDDDEDDLSEDLGYRFVHLSSIKQAFEKSHQCTDAVS